MNPKFNPTAKFRMTKTERSKIDLAFQNSQGEEGDVESLRDKILSLCVGVPGWVALQATTEAYAAVVHETAKDPALAAHIFTSVYEDSWPGEGGQTVRDAISSLLDEEDLDASDEDRDER